MAQRNTLAHFLHDAGLAVWFGGTLAGAVAVNGAAADVDDPRQRARVANAGWARWTPFNAVAIGAHLIGGAQLLKANKGRVATQQGVLANTNLKMALTAGALLPGSTGAVGVSSPGGWRPVTGNGRVCWRGIPRGEVSAPDSGARPGRSRRRARGAGESGTGPWCRSRLRTRCAVRSGAGRVRAWWHR